MEPLKAVILPVTRPAKDEDREERVALLEYRAANKLDLWTGKPLSGRDLRESESVLEFHEETLVDKIRRLSSLEAC